MIDGLYIAAGSTWAREQAIMARRLGDLGLTYKQYRLTGHWKGLVARLRGDRCEICSWRGRLVLHHVTYVRLGCELPEDLCTLCDPCHERIHRVAAAGPHSLDPRAPGFTLTTGPAKKRSKKRKPAVAKYSGPKTGALRAQVKVSHKQVRERYAAERTDGKNPLPSSTGVSQAEWKRRRRAARAAREAREQAR